MANKTYAGIGSRETPTLYIGYMAGIASRLKSLGWWLSSGHAIGADQAFESLAGDHKTIYTADTDIPEAAFELAAKFHPAWDACNDYAKRLHARNGMIVLGPNLNEPVSFIICWTKAGLVSGGTGQALRIADHYKIPVFNLAIEGMMDKIETFLEENASA
jgi:hypothetical protein